MENPGREEILKREERGRRETEGTKSVCVGLHSSRASESSDLAVKTGNDAEPPAPAAEEDDWNHIKRYTLSQSMFTDWRNRS
ncbi:hypothetical protein ACS0TY_025757 [Phlomoides rotata]